VDGHLVESRFVHPGADLGRLEGATVAPGVEEDAGDGAVLGGVLAWFGAGRVADDETAVGLQGRVYHPAEFAVACLR
jgi:hypothetical protein